MQRSSFFRYFNSVSSKVQGTVLVRQVKKVRNLNSTRILFCNPGPGALDLGARVEQLPHRGGDGRRPLRRERRAASGVAGLRLGRTGLQISGSKFQSSNSNSRELEIIGLVLGCIEAAFCKY